MVAGIFSGFFIIANVGKTIFFSLQKAMFFSNVWGLIDKSIMLSPSLVKRWTKFTTNVFYF